MDSSSGGGPGGETGLLQQILRLSLVPRVGNATVCPTSTALCAFPGGHTCLSALQHFTSWLPGRGSWQLGAGAGCGPLEMWYGVFLWALVSSLFFHIPAGLLALFTLRRHKYGRFMSVGILLMGILEPICAGILTSAAIAGVYKAAAKEMIPFEALVLGVGQTFCVLIVSFLRILATL